MTKDDVVSDATRATPHTTYGMTKACSELLLSDYSRKGFIDGRACRLPTVVVRAGSPNAATTGIFSGAVREPLAGLDTISPIAADVSHAVTGHRTAVEALLRMHESPADRVDAVLGYDRTVFVPCIPVSLASLTEALQKVVASDTHAELGRVSYDVDEKVSSAVGSFPTKVDSSRAAALGLASDLDAESFIRDYIEDFPSAIKSSLRFTARS